VPQARTIAFLLDPSFPAAAAQVKEVEAAARTLGVRLDVLRAGTDRAIDAAFETIARRRIGALANAAGPFFDTRREKLVGLAVRRRVPAIYHFREYVEAGGLISYGVDLADAYRQVGLYAARILKGAKPADLPVVQPTKFELVINLRTAETLRLAIPQPLLLRADAVIP
jgi:putative ABC transport system substrate-binding protein